MDNSGRIYWANLGLVKKSLDIITILKSKLISQNLVPVETRPLFMYYPDHSQIFIKTLNFGNATHHPRPFSASFFSFFIFFFPLSVSVSSPPQTLDHCCHHRPCHHRYHGLPFVQVTCQKDVLTKLPPRCARINALSLSQSLAPFT